MYLKEQQCLGNNADVEPPVQGRLLLANVRFLHHACQQIELTLQIPERTGEKSDAGPGRKRRARFHLTYNSRPSSLVLPANAAPFALPSLCSLVFLMIRHPQTAASLSPCRLCSSRMTRHKGARCVSHASSRQPGRPPTRYHVNLA